MTATSTWRDRSIDDLNLSDNAVKSLALHHVDNLGQLDDRIGQGETLDLTRKAITSIEKSIQAFKDEDAEVSEPEDNPADEEEQTEGSDVEEGSILPMTDDQLEALPMTEDPDQLADHPSESAQALAAPTKMVGCPGCSSTGVVGEAGDICPVCQGHMVVPAPQDQQPAAAVTVAYVEESEHDILVQIREAQQDVDDQEAKIAGMKEDLKDENKELEALQLRRDKLIRQTKDDQTPNLFNRKTTEGGGPVGDTPVTAGSTDELYRDFPLSRWVSEDWLPEHIVKKLAAHQSGITTVGQLADYQKPGANGWIPKLTDIEKIGKGAAEKIEEANASFWSWWRAGGEEKFAAEQAKASPVADVAPTTEQPTATEPEAAPSESETLMGEWQEPAAPQSAASM